MRFWQLYQPECAAILEDPNHLGRQFVVSKAGYSQSLISIEDASGFLSDWQHELKDFQTQKFPTIASLFYLAYEAGTLFEQLPEPKTKPTGGLIWRHAPEWSICFAPEEDCIYLSSSISEAQLDTWAARLLAMSHQAMSTRHKIPFETPVKLNTSYQEAVEKVRAYITAGDIFQANIAQFWQMPFAEDDLLSMYNTLRQVNPAPFSCFVKAGDVTLISASPERLFSIDVNHKVSARPIAGTRKRSEGEDDDRLSAELLLSEKERAEHIMLLDLERNDLGRVCVPGSIHVDECMVIEKYATVQHIVSNVSGQLEQKYHLLDVIKAMFPGGTITGCPKVRCMEIIHELEPVARGPYTGGVGYMAWDGSVDMNILIRTFWHEHEQLYWAAGAGIVADSIPAHEEVETEHKVAGLIRVFS
ncbi:MAG: aminodeoxychorismate synthase component I [Zetaproteobacteria bacterium CG2_30_46_52]|nr:MAG: aminodeoxychorismate synthase component I [Zetaproteobacteria bacterium CG2_30_46_52]